MSDRITFTIDDVEVTASRGQTVMQAADAAGIYIPRLCACEDLAPAGACRVCTVSVNGRPKAACTQPIAPDMIVDNDTEELRTWRKNVVEMLFVEGNHFCMVCEKSGNCELQALAYRLGITTPKYPYQFPVRELDASHPDVFIDHNRCILCMRCVRASQEVDHKRVFGMAGRGNHLRVAVNATRLGATDLAVTDAAAKACPVGAIVLKRVGYAVPIGQRHYDHEPIGAEIESRRTATTADERGG